MWRWFLSNIFIKTMAVEIYKILIDKSPEYLFF